MLLIILRGTKVYKLLDFSIIQIQFNQFQSNMSDFWIAAQKMMQLLHCAHFEVFTFYNNHLGNLLKTTTFFEQIINPQPVVVVELFANWKY